MAGEGEISSGMGVWGEEVTEAVEEQKRKAGGWAAERRARGAGGAAGRRGGRR